MLWKLEDWGENTLNIWISAGENIQETEPHFKLWVTNYYIFQEYYWSKWALCNGGTSSKLFVYDANLILDLSSVKKIKKGWFCRLQL